MEHDRNLPAFRLLRFFSLASFLSILVVALVIVFFFRYMVINAVNDLSAEINTAVARNALGSVEQNLQQFLSRHSRLASDEDTNAMPNSTLVQQIDRLVDGSGIVGVKVYSRAGIVVYSTKREQIGRNQNENPGFYKVIRGGIANKLIYRDKLNPWDRETSEDNLIQTYIPVIGKESQRPVGVFEIYSDANDIVRLAENAQLIVILVVTGALLILYLFLLSIARKADSTITQQRNLISERTQTLELLSAKLLNVQETERKRLAETLHENVAQSLMAIKLALENNRRHGDTEPPAPMLELIQSAIVQIRDFSIELRPSALDDFGVIDALNSLLRETRSAHENLTLDWEFKIRETDLPRPLRTIVFRIVKDTLRSLIDETETDKVQIILAQDKDKIQLTIRENAYSYGTAVGQASLGDTINTATMLMRERTILSGGEFTATENVGGTTENIAVWRI